ncbi:MAG: hypothetical protein M5U21_08700 [Fimbriimonadaceae bacterium]|nr:hypothetical protein [Fimbriimonadaceae bacterium]
MSNSEPSKKPYNIVVRAGIWITVGSGLIWVGGETYKLIQTFIPWAIGTGIAVLAVGLFFQFRSKPGTE